MIKVIVTTLVLTLSAINNLSASTKHALIVAIGNYPASSGWAKLASLRDAEYLSSALQRHGFPQSGITVVKDEEATASGIYDAFEALIKEVNQGDIVVIHFSCHGRQLAALNPQKLSKYDQCAVTYNAVYHEKVVDYAKEQAEYFRGQALGKYLIKLRNKLGKTGDVLVLLDYCYSGTGTRGTGVTRGGHGPLMPTGNVEGNIAKMPIATDAYQSGNADANNKSIATMVAISATRPDETDVEIADDNNQSIGPLTYAVCKSLANLEQGTSYRSLFAKVQSIMAKYDLSQHPLLEGDGADRAFFGGNFVVQKPYIEIDDLNNGKEIIIKGGELSGLGIGAKVSLYSAGTTDPNNTTPLATGKVISTSTFTSKMFLDKRIGLAKAVDGWVFVTEPVYNIKGIGIEIVSGESKNKWKRLNTNFSKTDVANIQNGLSELRLVNFTSRPDILLVKGSVVDTLLNAADGSLIDTIENVVSNISALKGKLKKYIQYSFLKNVEVRDNISSAEVRLIPFVDGKADINGINRKKVGGVYEFHENDKMVLWVKNTSSRPIYVNVLDLQPNGIINPILPCKAIGISPLDLKIQAGEEHTFDSFPITISPPFGTEVFKVFVSTEEIDLEGVANNGIALTKGGTPRGNLRVIENLVIMSDDLALEPSCMKRGASPDGTSYDIVFRIVP